MQDASGTERAALTLDAAWAIIRGLAALAKARAPVTKRCFVGRSGASGLQFDAPDAPLEICFASPRGWRSRGTISVEADVAQLLDIYVPLCVGAGADHLVVGHLGQSLDGRIATEGGVSQFITGEQNVEHAHRMRALFDAVLVGTRTVEDDDPRLTTRRVPGDHPARVVVDPARRLSDDRAVFRDEKAPTLLLCSADAARGAKRHGQAEIVPIESGEDGQLSVSRIVAALRDRGLGRVFIEGGGVTISRFLRDGALDRLHVAVAPMILGSGRPAFSMPTIETLEQAMTFPCSHFATGTDVLFDCDLDARRRRR